MLDFTPGGDNTLCSVISAADDDMREGQETFIFKLEISNDAVRMGQPSIAMLSIIGRVHCNVICVCIHVYVCVGKYVRYIRRPIRFPFRNCGAAVLLKPCQLYYKRNALGSCYYGSLTSVFILLT